jgi:hypothetical protein
MISIAQDSVSSSFQGLIYKVFQDRLGANPGRGIAIAFVAAHPGAGTTFLTTRLTNALHHSAVEPAVLLDCRSIASSNDEALYTPARTTAGEEEADAAQMALALPRGNWRANRNYRKQAIDLLRNRFSYILLDCPSLKESKDILGLTTLVDGIVLVVEANKTSKNQLDHLERSITHAGGNILGSLLNKRTYPIPNWLW